MADKPKPRTKRQPDTSPAAYGARRYASPEQKAEDRAGTSGGGKASSPKSGSGNSQGGRKPAKSKDKPERGKHAVSGDKPERTGRSASGSRYDGTQRVSAAEKSEGAKRSTSGPKPDRKRAPSAPKADGSKRAASGPRPDRSAKSAWGDKPVRTSRPPSSDKPTRAPSSEPAPAKLASGTPWVSASPNKGSQSQIRYMNTLRHRAHAVKSRREFGQLTIDTLVFVACEHRLVTMRLGAIKSLEAGDSRKHLAALRTIERCEDAGTPVRTAAHVAGNIVQARLDAK